jgi:hypothetical protein
MKKDKDEEYISTREAGKMLGISSSTAMCYFDKEFLGGETHLITNWRCIDKKSVLSLMKKHGMKIENHD